MKRYDGNGELIESIPEIQNESYQEDFTPFEENMDFRETTQDFSNVQTSPPIENGGLGAYLPKLLKAIPDFEDLMIIGFMYLLYRESGDIEFLIIAGAYLFL